MPIGIVPAVPAESGRIYVQHMSCQRPIVRIGPSSAEETATLDAV